MAATKNKAVPIDQDWEARHDFETLASAERIKSDPKRLERARLYGANQLSAAQRVMGASGTDPIKPPASKA